MRFRPANIRVINRRDITSATTDAAYSRDWTDRLGDDPAVCAGPAIEEGLLADLDGSVNATDNEGSAHSNNKLT